MNSKETNLMDKLVSLCKRRGIIFQSSGIYGGINSCWDYGPVGVELKNNIKRFWWQSMVYQHENIEGLDASIIMHPRVWEASGHVESFTDPLVDCKSCKRRFRADEVPNNRCPECGGELTEARQFNLMFKTHIGPVEE
ncbi:glycine--tRNA ligase, partial [candidate division KSB1 bacterium]